MLFHDEKDDVKANACCLDRKCWEKKQNEHLHVKLAAAQKEHGADLLYLHGEYSWETEHAVKPPKGAIVLSNYSWQQAKKSDAGAMPGFVVDGRGSGSVKWVRLDEMAMERLKQKGEDSPQTNASAMAAVREHAAEERERLNRAADLLAERIKVMTVDDLADGSLVYLLRLLLAFGPERYDWAEEWQTYRDMPQEDVLPAAWAAVREFFCDTLADCVAAADLEVISEAVGLTAKEFYDQAAKELAGDGGDGDAAD